MKTERMKQLMRQLDNDEKEIQILKRTATPFGKKLYSTLELIIGDLREEGAMLMRECKDK